MSSSPIPDDERVGIVSQAEYDRILKYVVTGTTGGNIILIGTSAVTSANYFPDESELPKEQIVGWRIFKVKCKSCKGNYQVKDKNSIYLTKCRLCGSGKLDFNL